MRLYRSSRLRNVAVTFVSHRLDEVLEIAERVTVLRNGENCGTFEVKGMTSRRLVELMSGKSFAYRPLDIAPPAEPLLEVRDLSRAVSTVTSRSASARVRFSA